MNRPASRTGQSDGRRGASNARCVAVLSAVAAVLALPAEAVEFPKLKPGLWESRINAGGPGGPAQASTRMCLDAATQREMIAEGQQMMNASCRRSEVRVESGRYVAEADCTMEGTRMKSRSVATFSGDSAYHVEVTASFDPPMMGMRESKTQIDVKHVGACPAGMKPGDISVAGGPAVNMRQMQQMMNAPPGGAPKR